MRSPYQDTAVMQSMSVLKWDHCFFLRRSATTVLEMSSSVYHCRATKTDVRIRHDIQQLLESMNSAIFFFFFLIVFSEHNLKQNSNLYPTDNRQVLSLWLKGTPKSQPSGQVITFQQASAVVELAHPKDVSLTTNWMSHGQLIVEISCSVGKNFHLGFLADCHLEMLLLCDITITLCVSRNLQPQGSSVHRCCSLKLVMRILSISLEASATAAAFVVSVFPSQTHKILQKILLKLFLHLGCFLQILWHVSVTCIILNKTLSNFTGIWIFNPQKCCFDCSYDIREYPLHLSGWRPFHSGCKMWTFRVVSARAEIRMQIGMRSSFPLSPGLVASWIQCTPLSVCSMPIKRFPSKGPRHSDAWTKDLTCVFSIWQLAFPWRTNELISRKKQRVATSSHFCKNRSWRQNRSWKESVVGFFAAEQRFFRLLLIMNSGSIRNRT